MTKAQGEVKTPNWPEKNYPAGISCSWLITVERDQVISHHVQLSMLFILNGLLQVMLSLCCANHRTKCALICINILEFQITFLVCNVVVFVILFISVCGLGD